MARANKPGEDENDIKSQVDDLLKSLDLLDKPSKASTQSASTGNTRDPSPDKLPAQKTSSFSVLPILVAAASFAGIALIVIEGLKVPEAFEASKKVSAALEAFKQGLISTSTAEDYITYEELAAKVEIESYCAQTQTDHCIIVDANGYWWDSEPSLNPVYKKSKRASLKISGKTKIARFGNTFYCTKSELAAKSYLTCTSDGWVFKN